MTKGWSIRACLQCGKEAYVRSSTKYCGNVCRIKHGSKEMPNGCWEWQGSIGAGGYGRTSDGKAKSCIYAHRVSYEAFHGPLEKGQMACHTCDNRSCVNPAHLFLGTASDNVADMVAKGRGVRGSKHPLAKLTESEAAFIRESTDARLALAKQFNVDAAIIDRIRQGKSWKHVA